MDRKGRASAWKSEGVAQTSRSSNHCFGITLLDNVIARIGLYTDVNLRTFDYEPMSQVV